MASPSALIPVCAYDNHCFRWLASTTGAPKPAPGRRRAARIAYLMLSLVRVWSSQATTASPRSEIAVEIDAG